VHISLALLDVCCFFVFFFSSRRRHTISKRDWSSDVCSSDLFVEAIEDGGVAAMEVLARDLKALGLYAARSLSFEGVEYELVEHRSEERRVGKECRSRWGRDG